MAKLLNKTEKKLESFSAVCTVGVTGREVVPVSNHFALSHLKLGKIR